MTNNATIFVTGGTGNQGGAVARNLIKEGFNVKVLTRNSSSPKAQRLKKLNIQLVEGNLDHADSYREHLKNVQAIFCALTFENGVSKETKQGITLANAAKEAGVKHFLYSSTLGAESDSHVPHFESKFKIENHIRQIGLPFTILRPASLYENFLLPQVKKGILKGNLVQPINRDTIVQYVAAEDIGHAAVQIFQRPEMYIGETRTLIAEQLTPQQVANIFSSVLKMPVKYKKLPTLITRLFLGRTLYKMFNWLDEKDRFSNENLHSSRKEFPFLMPLESWIKTTFLSSSF